MLLAMRTSGSLEFSLISSDHVPPMQIENQIDIERFSREIAMAVSKTHLILTAVIDIPAYRIQSSTKY